jgi:kanamycin nucleotidyltransferase
MELARAIADRLLARYGDVVQAIGLYGSVARKDDGPYSDIEMHCVLRPPGETRNYEWCAGPWKAEVNVRTEASLREEAAQLEGDWALTHSAYVHILPLIEWEQTFAGLSELVMAHSADDFRAVIEGELVGEISELIGKVRNASGRKHYHALPPLAVDLARRTALVLGLEHRHLYRTAGSVLDEATALPNPPLGFPSLSRLVTTGELSNPSILVDACNAVWSGLTQWAAERGYRLISTPEIPI